MALDLFQTSDQTHFWNIFSGAIGVTYLAAIIALVAIYRGDTVDLLSSATKWLSNERPTKTQIAETKSKTSILGKLRQRFHTKGEVKFESQKKRERYETQRRVSCYDSVFLCP